MNFNFDVISYIDLNKQLEAFKLKQEERDQLDEQIKVSQLELSAIQDRISKAKKEEANPTKTEEPKKPAEPAAAAATAPAEEKKGLVNGQEQINHLEEQVRKLEG